MNEGQRSIENDIALLPKLQLRIKRGLGRIVGCHAGSSVLPPRRGLTMRDARAERTGRSSSVLSAAIRDGSLLSETDNDAVSADGAVRDLYVCSALSALTARNRSIPVSPLV